MIYFSGNANHIIVNYVKYHSSFVKLITQTLSLISFTYILTLTSLNFLKTLLNFLIHYTSFDLLYMGDYCKC